MSECTHDCSNCASECGDRTEPMDFRAHLNAASSVKHVIAVVSGKGGVGKSLVTALLASNMNKRGYKSAILDADITGPSAPKAFGLSGTIKEGSEAGIPTMKTESGIQMISVNFLLNNETDPVIWRGPVLAGCVKQFFSEFIWEDVDYMFVDMPPGTGDIPLTVFQSLPVEGIIVVTSPQDLVGMIVEKAVKMAAMMDIPVLGIVQNMAYYECPNCHEKHFIFGNSDIKKLAESMDVKHSLSLPIDPHLAELVDAGKIEEYTMAEADELVKMVL